MHTNHSPYHMGDKCYHDLPCENYRSYSSKYQVIFKSGEVRISVVIKADSIGGAVFAATKMLQHSIGVNVGNIVYDSCVPVN
jgi:hypothetical protein